MTPFRTHREAIGWSIQHTADRLGVNERTIRRWDAGDTQPPARIVAWLADFADAIARVPPPAG